MADETGSHEPTTTTLDTAETARARDADRTTAARRTARATSSTCGPS